MWDKLYNYAGGNDEAFDLRLIPTGGYIVAGYATTVTATPVDIDMWLIKLDENGNKVWDEIYSNTGSLRLKGDAVTTIDDGGFLILGTEWGGFSDQDLIAVKTNSAGVEQWRHTIPNQAGTNSNGVTWGYQKSDGDFSITGTLNNDYALITIDEDGSSHSTVSWGTAYNRDYIDDADTTPDGGYIVAGTQYTPDNDDDAYLARLDSHGNVLWNKTYGEPGVGGENGEAVASLSNGSIILVYSDYYDGVMRVTKIGPNTLPTGDFTVNPASPIAGASATFTAVLNDSDGTVYSLIWDFGAGQGDPVETTLTSITHTYASEGNYTVTLTAYDTSGGELVISHDVIVSVAPEDLCPDDPDKIVPGICGCGVPDTDTDVDSLADCIDNCPAVANTDQLNSDDDEYGDVCDDDDDNDGMPDSWEILYIGLNPLVDDADGDLDHDSITNYEEYLAGTSPGPRRGSLPFIPLLLED